MVLIPQLRAFQSAPPRLLPPPSTGIGVDVEHAIIALVSIQLPVNASLTADIYGRTIGSDHWTLINGFADVFIDQRGWRETLRVPMEAELYVQITTSTVSLDRVQVIISPAMGGDI